MAADGGCERDVVHRMNEGYRAWGALKSVLSNRGLRITAKKCLYEGVIVTTEFVRGRGMGEGKSPMPLPWKGEVLREGKSMFLRSSV